MPTVIYIDHEDWMAESLRSVMKDSGVSVVYCEGSVEFLRHPERPAPDLLVLELGLPQIGGYDFLGWWFQIPKYRGIPVVAVCAVIEDSLIAELLDMGVSKFMRRPFDFGSLKEVVLRLLRGR